MPEVLILVTFRLFAGYGATTFPALTEALTLYSNVTMARDEARRLQDRILCLADYMAME